MSDRFGAYRVVREIGRGGMGAVFLAERADDEFKQKVALKILRGEFNPQDVLRRFRHERQILAGLAHPNICRLLDGGSTPSGEPYLVMDYIDGVSMERYAEEHHLSIKQRIELFRQVCAAVQYVHQNLIVHRDLKPSNILVQPDGTAKLLDFGIAKIIPPENAADDETRTQAQMMTPAYASPEQIRGDIITTSTDVYSLGVILYELLTGHHPYRLKTTSAHELPRAILEDQPERPSTVVSRAGGAAPEDVQRHLKGDLDNIVLKALRKEPERRYASVELFSEDLRRHLANLPVTAHQDSFGYRAAKFVQRYKIAVIAATLAVISLIAGLVTTVIEARIARRERALAESRFQDVRKLAKTFLFDVHDAIENLPGSTPARALIAKTGTEYLDRLATQSHGDLGLQQDIASGYIKVGDVEGDPFGANLGEPAKAVENYRKGLAMAQDVVARSPGDRKAKQLLAWAHFQLAGVLPSVTKTGEGLKEAGLSASFYEELLSGDPKNVEAKLDVARAYERVGDLLGGAQSVNLGKRAEAAAAYRKALDFIPSLSGNAPLAPRAARGRVVIITKLIAMQGGTRLGPQVLDRYKEALEIAQAASDAAPNDSRALELVAAVLNKIGGAQISFGDLSAGEATYRKAAAIYEKGTAADPNNDRARQGTMGFYKNFGDLYFYSLKNWAEALRCYRRAADLMDAEHRSDPKNVIVTQRYSEVLTCIGSCLLRLNQPNEARHQTKLGLDMARELADRPGATRDHIYNYAWLAITVEPDDMQEPKRALPYAQKAVELDPKDDYAWHVLAQAEYALADYTKCIEAEEKGLALYPPLAPGAAKTGMQSIMESQLASCRKK